MTKKMRPKREKKPKPTDAELAARMRAKASGGQERVDSINEEADILEKHGRRTLKAVQHCRKLDSKLEKLRLKLAAQGVSGF